jgi:Peptidase family M28
LAHISRRAIARIVLLSLVAASFLSFSAAKWVEAYRVDRQRAVRPAGSTEAGRLDGRRLMETVRYLASDELDGRRTGSPGGLKARAWIAERFKTIGLEPLASPPSPNGSGRPSPKGFGGPGFLMPFSFTHKSVKGLVDPKGQFQTKYTDAANIVGICRGSDASRDQMVISAHYDHVGIRDGAIYHGADDNASGVAVLLAIAEDCRREAFRHDAIFAAFDAEELGLQGAKAFVSQPPVPLERIKLNVNLDMVSRNDRDELFAAGTYHWPKTKPALEQVAARAPIKLLFGHDKPILVTDDWTHQSDHGPFHDAGIPFVYFGVEDHPDYHKPSDTADRIPLAFFQHAADTILDAVRTLDAALPFDR